MTNVTSIYGCDTVNDLKTIQCNMHNQLAVIKGKKDGTISMYYFDPSSTAVDNSASTATVVAVTGQSLGRWLKVTLA